MIFIRYCVFCANKHLMHLQHDIPFYLWVMSMYLCTFSKNGVFLWGLNPTVLWRYGGVCKIHQPWRLFTFSKLKSHNAQIVSKLFCYKLNVFVGLYHPLSWVFHNVGYVCRVPLKRLLILSPFWVRKKVFNILHPVETKSLPFGKLMTKRLIFYKIEGLSDVCL